MIPPAHNAVSLEPPPLTVSVKSSPPQPAVQLDPQQSHLLSLCLVQIADFGLATILEVDDVHSQTVVGTPNYMYENQIE